jgi:hypothetical protein
LLIITAMTNYPSTSEEDEDSAASVNYGESHSTVEHLLRTPLHENLGRTITPKSSTSDVNHGERRKLLQSPATSPRSSSTPNAATLRHDNDNPITANDHHEKLLSPLHRKRGQLREKEERFNVLIKSTTNHMDEIKMLKCQLQNLVMALQEKETEANELDKEVRRCRKQISTLKHNNNNNNIKHKSVTGGTSSSDSKPNHPFLLAAEAVTTTILQERLTQTQHALEVAQKESSNNSSKVAELECALHSSREEIAQLNVELEDRLRVLIGYEIDLETHTINFTNYAKEQQRLEEEALEELFGTTLDEAKDSSKEQAKIHIAAIEEKYQCRTQHLIAKLLADYADMETRYKRDRMESVQRIEKLEAENQDLNASMMIQQQQQKQGQDRDSSPSSSSTIMMLQPSTSFFVQRIQVLEKEVLIQRDAKKNLEEQLKTSQDLLLATQDEAKLATSNQNQAMEVMLLEMDAMTAKLAIIDKQHEENDNASLVGKPQQQEHLQAYSQLEQKIKEQNKTITKLLAERDNRDRQIASLRSEAINYQMRRSVRNLLRSAQVTSSSSLLSEGHRSIGMLDTAVLAADISKELQQELQDMQELLFQQEDELAAERQQFAKREAEWRLKLQAMAVTISGSQPEQETSSGQERGEPTSFTPTPMHDHAEQALFFF